MSDNFLIYFAHPAFNQDQIDFKHSFKRSFYEAIKLAEKSSKFTIPTGREIILLDPFDFSPAIEADRESKKLLTKSILKINLHLVCLSSLIVAVIDDRDLGVAVEIGYAIAHETPIVTVSKTNFDSNVMIHGASIAHVTNILTESGMKNLANIVYGLAVSRGLF